jgi:hypothetical protein
MLQAIKRVKAPTKAQVEQFLDLEARRLEMARAAKDLRDESRILEEHFQEWVEQETDGRAVKSVAKFGLNFALVDGAKSISWKSEFIRLAGDNAEAEVEAVRDAAVAPTILAITPVAR